MKTAALLSHRLRELFLNGHWIANTNYREQLEATDLHMATHQIGQHNTIAALTFHINYYLEGLLTVCRGGPLTIRDVHSFDMPPVHSDEQWKAMIQQLLTHAESFAQAVQQIPDEQLSAHFVREEYGTWQRNIEAVIEHGYYHLGQISMLRKLLTTAA